MSKKMKTVLVVVALLVGIGVFNYVIQMDPTQLAARGVGKDGHSHGEDEAAADGASAAPTMEELTQPVGPDDAPVTIQVLWQDQQELEGLLRPMLSAVASSYDGSARVEFVDPTSDEYKQLVEETGGMGVGLLINGEMIKEVPEADLGMLAFVGSPAMEEWGEREVRLAVEHDLKRAGVEFTPRVEHDHSGAGQAPAPQAGHDH